MANNITAAEVRSAGGWETEDISDADLESAAYIPVGDAWLHTVIGGTLSEVTDTKKSAMLKAAEIYFVAHLVILRPPHQDFSAGPYKEKDIPAEQREKGAKGLLAIAEEFLNQAGYNMNVSFSWKYKGGDDYHPDNDNDSNIDFGLVESDRPLNPWNKSI